MSSLKAILQVLNVEIQSNVRFPRKAEKILEKCLWRNSVSNKLVGEDETEAQGGLEEGLRKSSILANLLGESDATGRFPRIVGKVGNHGNDGKFEESLKIFNQI